MELHEQINLSDRDYITAIETVGRKDITLAHLAIGKMDFDALIGSESETVSQSAAAIGITTKTLRPSFHQRLPIDTIGFFALKNCTNSDAARLTCKFLYKAEGHRWLGQRLYFTRPAEQVIRTRGNQEIS